MSVQSASRVLHDAERALFQKWRRVNEMWNDAAAEKFREEYLEDLPTMIRAASSAMNEINEAIHRARRECDRDG